MSTRQVSKRKLDYRARLEEYLRDYKKILVIEVDNVGSKQLQKIRLALRGSAKVILGKNTIIRKVLRELGEQWDSLRELVYGNIGFVFTNGDLAKTRDLITQFKVPAGARTGALAPQDYIIPAGPTGLDPGQTAFFQALNIATKIVKGSIEIINDVHICKKGEKVTASAVSLLNKMDIKPFFYGVQINNVCEDGLVYSTAVLDITDEILLAKFSNAIGKITALCLQINYPTAFTVPHIVGRAFKKILALSIAADFTFPQAQKYKDFLANPGAFAAAAPAPAKEEKKEAAKAAPAKKEPEPEPEDDAPMPMDLFD